MGVVFSKSDLVLLAADVDHVVAHPAADHGHAPGQGVVGRRQLIRPDGGHRGPRPVIHLSVLFVYCLFIVCLPRAGDTLRSRPQERLPLHILSHDDILPWLLTSL